MIIVASWTSGINPQAQGYDIPQAPGSRSPAVNSVLNHLRARAIYRARDTPRGDYRPDLPARPNRSLPPPKLKMIIYLDLARVHSIKMSSVPRAYQVRLLGRRRLSLRERGHHRRESFLCLHALHPGGGI